ncbi:peptidylprolyl isomerase [Pontibacillus salicampi]|uniref:Foldase protein PrsA n=1 Tax=Pontibacillus salicampi TaxID=1449801 RepID=A0ABV6LM53_9BACI
MKKIALTTTLAAGLLALTACSNSEGNSEVVVESSNGNVTKEELYTELKDRYGDQVVKEMVMTEVLSDDYEVTDEEVEEEMNKMKEQYGDQFGAVLQQSGFKDEEAFKKFLKDRMLEQKAMKSTIDVTDEDVNNRYERMQTELEASHILLESEEKAKEVAEMVKKGDKSFAELAKEHSTGPSSSKGGELGTFSAGTMDPAFEDAAYSLDKGEVSEPIKSSFGWHIIKLTGKSEKEEAKPLDEMKEDIKEEIRSQKLSSMSEEERQAILDKVLEDADVQVKDEQFKDLFEASSSEESDSESSDSEE